jgi:phosphoesterase RecJ-like protein
LYKQVWELIEKSHYITLISHVNPDGDTLGGMLSFYPTLKKMGKNVSLFNASKEISTKYDFLPNFKKIKKIFPQKCDLLISFDCGSFDRLGVLKEQFKIINIDHHKSNTLYGDINIVDASCASCTLIVMDMLEQNGKITKDEATCIYAGLVEDTGFFMFSNTDEEIFIKASKLISLGVNPAEIAQNLKMRNSLAKTRLTAIFINNIELFKDAKIAVGYITQKDLKKSGALKSDTVHLVDILRNLATIELAIFIIQLEDLSYKISLRSKEEIDVSSLAEAFGGGGHKRSSGFEHKLIDTDKLIEQIINKVKL